MFHTKVVQKIRTHVLCSMYLQKIVLFEITWKNSANPDRPQLTIRRLRIACSISTATRRHSEYVIPIALLQQRLHERASMLRCYVHCLSSLLTPNDVTSLWNAILCAFTITVTITLNVTSRARLSGLSQNWITENYMNVCPQTIISAYSGQY
jgi:hypothetical protein